MLDPKLRELDWHVVNRCKQDEKTYYAIDVGDAEIIRVYSRLGIKDKELAEQLAAALNGEDEVSVKFFWRSRYMALCQRIHDVITAENEVIFKHRRF